MNLQVLFQFENLIDAILVTDIALPPQCIVVGLLVASEGTELSKRFVADRTRMWTHSGMRPHMTRQSPLLRKRLGTFSTLKCPSLIYNLVYVTRNLLRQMIHLRQLPFAQPDSHFAAVQRIILVEKQQVIDFM